MTEFGATCLAWSATFGYWALIAAFALSLVRLVKGPTLPDRIVALDLMTVLATAFTVLLAIDNGEGHFIDVALALGLVSFLATVGFARYVMTRDVTSAANLPASPSSGLPQSLAQAPSPEGADASPSSAREKPDA